MMGTPNMTTIAKPAINGKDEAKPQARDLAKAMTRSAFIHIQDCLNIGKLCVFVGQYAQGSGASKTATAYLDVDAARVLLGDILLRGNLPEALYPGGKWESYGGSERDGRIEARVFRIRMDPDKRSPVVIEVATGPGKRNATGGFQPDGKMDTVSIYLDVMTARKLAAAVMAQLAAWDVCSEAERRRKAAC